MKTTITPKFTTNLSSSIKTISNNKYNKVTINDENGMVVENSEIFKSYDLKHGFINYLVNDRGAIVAKNVTPSELASLLHQAEN